MAGFELGSSGVGSDCSDTGAKTSINRQKWGSGCGSQDPGLYPVVGYFYRTFISVKCVGLSPSILDSNCPDM